MRLRLPSTLIFLTTFGLAEEAPDFHREIRPLLSDRCFACHGFDANAREADLRLDTPEGAFAPRPGGPAITPGNPEISVAWKLIVSTDPGEVMPPAKSHLKLSPKEKELLRRWIATGARYEPHPYFLPVAPPELPGLDPHPVDDWIRLRLRRERLDLAPEADRSTLIRRLSLDVRGLPPTPGEIQAFLQDDSPQAWENLVDRFLADPAFGERMAWPWLDAARYADSNGYQGDSDRTAWPWRDWVVQAFNRNLPHDRFILWQIAGDLLPEPSREQLLATAFLRHHPINGEGGRIPEENRVEYAMDMLETAGTTFMALTLNCCRCHDHKYDPLTQRDYYRLLDFFNQTPVDGSGGDPQTPPVLEIPDAEQETRLAGLESQARSLETELAGLAQRLAPGQAAWEKSLETPASTPWTPLDLPEIPGFTCTRLPDRSLLVLGPNPEQATFELPLQPPAGDFHALRLDALRHSSMTHGGIARSDSGNFVLTHVEIRVLRPDSPPSPVRLSRAEATFEQGGYGVAGALTPDAHDGWAVWAGKPVDRDHAAIFHFEQPLHLDPGDRLVVILRHESPHLHHYLGRFRLSLASQARPALDHAAESLARLASIPATERSGADRETLRQAFLHSLPDYLAVEKQLASRREEISGIRRSLPKVMVMADLPEPRTTSILAVGAYDKPLEAVQPGTPSILPPLTAAGPRPNRLDLARWLVSPEHPLTSRTTVNRLWQEWFGQGLVRTPEDFGVQSEVPTHPELLDWLAADLIRHQWDFKRLARTILTSRTYRQSSRITPEALERDPANRLLARGPRFRLPAWMIHDQALAASGLLVRTQGGPPVKPYQPENLWPDATFGRVQYRRDQGENLYRRSLYTFWRRISMPPQFFDNAKREICSVNPSRTNTPLHALTTLNDITFNEAARHLAVRALEHSPQSVPAALDHAFLLVHSRSPAPAENSLLVAAWESALAEWEKDPSQAARYLAIGDSPPSTSSLPAPQLAALASVCLNLLNTDEALNRE